MKLKIGDQVVVTSGKDKGKKGKIEKVFPGTGRVLVPGVNMYKKTRKGFGGEKGGIFEFARPLFPGNVALVCPGCGKQTRVGFRIDKRGEKTRICAKCKREISGKEGKK